MLMLLFNPNIGSVLVFQQIMQQENINAFSSNKIISSGMENKKNIKILICGGGTGGHVFPAIAIANALKQKQPDIKILFVGASDKMEMQKVPEAGYNIEGLWISGFQRSLSFKNLMFPFKLISSIIKSSKIIDEFKPNVVVGVGGYSSGPVVYMASRKGIPTLIQEQNSYPGITNKILAKKVDKICVAYDGMDKYFPRLSLVKTGNPVRKIITQSSIHKAKAISHFNLNPDKKIILVLGGSLGAKTINETINDGIKKLLESGVQILWQTGKSFFDTAVRTVQKMGSENIIVKEFISEMDHAYVCSDIIVSRAGAISVSEICIAGKPTIFIPSPNVAEDHQTKNAMMLVNQNAALLVRDSESRIMLVNRLLELIKNSELQEQLKNNISKLKIINASETIAEEILQMVQID